LLLIGIGLLSLVLCVVNYIHEPAWWILAGAFVSVGCGAAALGFRKNPWMSQIGWSLIIGGGIVIFKRSPHHNTLLHTPNEIWGLGLLMLAGSLLLAVAVWRNHRRLKVLKEQGLYPKEGQGTDGDVERLAASGEKIVAIRLYREIHHVTLAVAKQAVEALVQK
jgi:hypothetical protein